MTDPNFVSLDAPRVHRDHALELMVHHLQMAHMYYQATRDDHEANRAEITRMLTEDRMISRWVDDGGLGGAELVPYYPDHPEIVGTMAFVDALDAKYDQLRSEDEEQ